jgi:hypothetical protein
MFSPFTHRQPKRNLRCYFSHQLQQILRRTMRTPFPSLAGDAIKLENFCSLNLNLALLGYVLRKVEHDQQQ